ncbi:MAG: hypothetical protein ACRDJS_05015 [Actinomycetota bacterium]|jgi:hypothetical protein
MRRSSAGSPWRALLGTAVLIVVLAASPALAGPVVEAFDRADNDFLFTYTGDGSIPEAASSAIFRRSDKVSFFAYVRARPKAPEGRRLAGVLDLRLTGPRAVRYEGRFAFLVRNMNGSRALRLTTTRSFTLRPGDRREIIRFRFDLDPRRYFAFARFKVPEG